MAPALCPKKSMSCSSMEDLPEDVMFDILSRLPVKTIINCKCVCNKWRNLVLDQCVLIYDSNHLVSLTPTGTLKLLVIENEVDRNQYVLHDTFISHDQIAVLFPESRICTVGSANGLICLWGLDDEGDNTYICNPITKEYMILPKHQFGVNKYCWFVRYGFGVSTTGEYKVIWFWTSEEAFEIEVYTLGTDKWRTLGHFPYRPAAYDHGLFFNNHVHWIVDDQLFSFNLADKTFQLFSLPPLSKGMYVHKFLGVLKGCVGLFFKPKLKPEIVSSIWVLKEHGIEKAWHKELEIQESIIPYTRLTPLRLIDGLNGRSILFFKSISDEVEDQLLAYCLETNTIEELKIFDNFLTVRSYRPRFLKLQNLHPVRVHVF